MFFGGDDNSGDAPDEHKIHWLKTTVAILGVGAVMVGSACMLSSRPEAPKAATNISVPAPK